MQIVGLALLAFVVWFGFAERADTTISAFDVHAAVMVLGGSLSAILVSSSVSTAIRTVACLREMMPGLGTLQRGTAALEADRAKLVELWLEGKRAAAVELRAQSGSSLLDFDVAATKRFVDGEVTRWSRYVKDADVKPE